MSKIIEKPLSCSVKPLQLLNIGESDFTSGCGVIDVTFPNIPPIKLKKITFRNYYAASLSIKLKVSLIFSIFPLYCTLLFRCLIKTKTERHN